MKRLICILDLLKLNNVCIINIILTICSETESCNRVGMQGNLEFFFCVLYTIWGWIRSWDSFSLLLCICTRNFDMFVMLWPRAYSDTKLHCRIWARFLQHASFSHRPRYNDFRSIFVASQMAQQRNSISKIILPIILTSYCWESWQP